MADRRRNPLQRSEQAVTSGQLSRHFLRHENGRPQTTQIFSGRLGLRCVTGGHRVQARAGDGMLNLCGEIVKIWGMR